MDVVENVIFNALACTRAQHDALSNGFMDVLLVVPGSFCSRVRSLDNKLE